MVVALLIGIFILLGGLGLLWAILGNIIGVLLIPLLFLISLLAVLVEMLTGYNFMTGTTWWRTLRASPPKEKPVRPNVTDPLAIVKWASEGLDKKAGPGTPTLPPAESTGVKMRKFQYQWKINGVDYVGEIFTENESALRDHVNRIGGELIGVESNHPTRDEALAAWRADPNDKRTWGQAVHDWERSVKEGSP